MSQVPSLAVVVDGGLVQYVTVQDWPASLPLPRIAVVDYDVDGADEDELIRIPIAGITLEARCHSETPVVVESSTKALSPRAILAALDATDDGPARLPLAPRAS
jgi:hypothetical protein